MKQNEVIGKIKREFSENKNSHVFLIETNDIESLLTDVKSIIKEDLNLDDDVKHQIDEETYLELIVIRPDGREIKKEQIFELQSRIKTKPILSNKIFYVIMNSEKMNILSMNKLLKTIEEPSDGVIGFLLTENVNLVLPTILSRSEFYRINYEMNNNVGSDEKKEIITVADRLIVCLENKDLLSFNLYKRSNDYFKDHGFELANTIKMYYNMASGIEKYENLNNSIVEFIKKNNSNKECINKAIYLNKTLNELSKNMNIGLLLEKLFLEMEVIK